jgi:hypothetical protein
VADHGAGWIMGEDEWRDDERLLARIVALCAPQGRAALDAAAARARAMPLPPLDDMVRSTRSAYHAATRGPAPDLPPVDRRRVVEAFGYQPWNPPPPPASAPAIETAVPRAQVPEPPPPLARVALQLRTTPAGRALARLLPPGARAALWQRLTSRGR